MRFLRNAATPAIFAIGLALGVGLAGHGMGLAPEFAMAAPATAPASPIDKLEAKLDLLAKIIGTPGTATTSPSGLVGDVVKLEAKLDKGMPKVGQDVARLEAKLDLLGQANTTGTLTGHVTNPAGNPVALAPVDLYSGTTPLARTQTNSDGDYRFAGVPANTTLTVCIRESPTRQSCVQTRTLPPGGYAVDSFFDIFFD